MSSLFHLYVNLSRNSSLFKLNLNACPLEPELIKIRETTFFKKNFYRSINDWREIAEIQIPAPQFRALCFRIEPFSATRETKDIKSVSDYWFSVWLLNVSRDLFCWCC